MKIAVLGYGTVGSGVHGDEVIQMDKRQEGKES